MEEDCRAEMMKRATAKFSFLKRKNRMVYGKKGSGDKFFRVLGLEVKGSLESQKEEVF